MVTVYLKRGEEMFGPFTPDEIKAGVQNRQVINGDLISQSAEGPWTSVEDIKGLGLDEEPVMQPQLSPIKTQSVLEQPVQQKAWRQHVPVQQQVPQHVPAPKLVIPGLSKGTFSPDVASMLCGVWPLGWFIYGKPFLCRIPKAAGSSAIDAIAELFFSRGYTKRMVLWKKQDNTIRKGRVKIKCPGAIVNFRDIKIKESDDSITVRGHLKNIEHVLFDAGLIDAPESKPAWTDWGVIVAGIVYVVVVGLVVELLTS